MKHRGPLLPCFQREDPQGAGARQTPDEERSLAQGLRDGDPAWTAEFFERTHASVYAFACRFPLDPETRQDLVHDCLLRIVDDVREERFQYRHPGSFWAWFRKRSWYRIMEGYRDHRRYVARLDGEETLDRHVAMGDGPDEDLRHLELAEAVESCLDDIQNERHREAIRLLLTQQLHYQEIADLMATSLQNVRTWVRRGRITLRSCLIERLELAPEKDRP